MSAAGGSCSDGGTNKNASGVRGTGGRLGVEPIIIVKVGGRGEICLNTLADTHMVGALNSRARERGGEEGIVQEDGLEVRVGAGGTLF